MKTGCITRSICFPRSLSCLRMETADFWSLKGKAINTGLSTGLLQLTVLKRFSKPSLSEVPWLPDEKKIVVVDLMCVRVRERCLWLSRLTRLLSFAYFELDENPLLKETKIYLSKEIEKKEITLLKAKPSNRDRLLEDKICPFSLLQWSERQSTT